MYNFLIILFFHPYPLNHCLPLDPEKANWTRIVISLVIICLNLKGKPGKCTLCGQDVQDLARHVNADHTNRGQGIRDQDLMIRINRLENQIN